jgi:hypothetical protein
MICLLHGALSLPKATGDHPAAAAAAAGQCGPLPQPLLQPQLPGADSLCRQRQVRRLSPLPTTNHQQLCSSMHTIDVSSATIDVQLVQSAPAAVVHAPTAILCWGTRTAQLVALYGVSPAAASCCTTSLLWFCCSPVSCEITTWACIAYALRLSCSPLVTSNILQQPAVVFQPCCSE